MGEQIKAIYRYFFIVYFSCFVISLEANDITNYTQGLNYFQTKQYDKAFIIIQKEAEKGNKEAQYLLATLYEKGLGTSKNIEKSLYWYKQASSTYAYITKTDTTKKDTTTDGQVSQSDAQNTQQGLQFLFSKLDLSSDNVKNEIVKIVNKDFGLMPYHANYILPFSYSSKKHSKRYTNIQTPIETYESNIESEFQLSFQKNLSYNLFGFNEYITLAYTQHVWWQIYTDSAPFRETNYTPELFVTVPTSYEVDQLSNLKAIRFGYRHQSNGQGGYRSRSWDRLFLATFWQWDNLFLKLEGWYRFPEEDKSSEFYNGTNINDKGDDNPDINKYLGYGDIELQYLYGTSQFGLMLRNNLRSKNKGAVEFEWSVPIHNSKNTYWYMKVFNGYGESLIDYDQSRTKFSFGFSFFRNLF
jgi:phospholipase A1/A2